MTPDLIGVLEALDRHGVRCVVIGGLAANLLGSPILTNDVDVCYARDDANLERLAAALTALDASLRGAPPGLAFTPDAATLRAGDRFTFTTRLGPLDVLGQPDGSGGYEALRRTARRFTVRGVQVLVCSLDDLITMKRAAGRVKDRLMVEELAALREERDRLAAEGHDPDAGLPDRPS
ncbi:MAG: hypothetical protein WD250_15545 [Egibacteraceae bacterium]